MACLAAVNYDPGTAVSKATSSLLALTAFDTTNVRCTFVGPNSGKVWVRVHVLVTGATTFPTILLGVLDGSTIMLRASPTGGLKNTAVATAFVDQEITGVIAVTPGTTYNWDAAYGVETIVASTNVKYGGPNNATANDAWGAIQFEVWEA